MTKGVLDISECNQKIEDLKVLRYQTIQNRDNLFARLTSALEKTQHSTNNGYLISGICNYQYQPIIDLYTADIKRWEAKRQAAWDYNTKSSSLYADAKACIDAVLYQATLAIEGCLRNGFYSPETHTLLSLLNAMRDCLNAEEFAAMEAALKDGEITADEIYNTQDGTFNEVLYSALAKLPSSVVTQANVEAVAEAYNTMWINEDTKSVERLFELSYVREPYSAIDFDVPNSHYLEATYSSWSIFRQSPLPKRLSDALQIKMYDTSKNDPNYLALLAGTNLIDVLAKDDRLLFSDKVDFTLEAVTNDPPDALICSLGFYPERDDMPEDWKSRFLNTDEEATRSFKYVTFSGEMESIYNLINEFKNKELTADGLQWFGPAPAMITTGISQAVSIGAKVTTRPIAFVSIIQSIASAIKDAEAAGALQDTRFGSIATYADSEVIKECGYTLNLRLDSNTKPADYLNPEANLYIFREAESNINNAIEYYERYSGTSYSLDTFRDDLINNPRAATVSSDTNETRGFIAWCDEDADLVYGVSVVHDGVLVFSTGDSARSDVISNYGYIVHRDDFPGRIYEWEWKEK
jgi:hypothetical protein